MYTMIALIITLLLLPAPLLTRQIEGESGSNRPKIGLALSGGGARGIAQIGVLRALERENVTIEMIAGTSMGSVMGGLYASGCSPDEIESLMVNTDWRTIFSDAPIRSSLFTEQKSEWEKHIVQIRLDGLKPRIPKALSSGHKPLAMTKSRS